MTEDYTDPIRFGGPLTPAQFFPGPAGKSAYQVAVAEGFVGTVDEWLESLKGADGSGVAITELAFVETQYVIGTGVEGGPDGWFGSGSDIHLTDITAPVTQRIWVDAPFNPDFPNPFLSKDAPMMTDQEWLDYFGRSSVEIDIFDFDDPGVTVESIEVFKDALVNDYSLLGEGTDGWMGSFYRGVGEYASLTEGHRYVLVLLTYDATTDDGRTYSIGNLPQRMTRLGTESVVGDQYDTSAAGLVERPHPLVPEKIGNQGYDPYVPIKINEFENRTYWQTLKTLLTDLDLLPIQPSSNQLGIPFDLNGFAQTLEVGNVGQALVFSVIPPGMTEIEPGQYQMNEPGTYLVDFSFGWLGVAEERDLKVTAGFNFGVVSGPYRATNTSAGRSLAGQVTLVDLSMFALIVVQSVPSGTVDPAPMNLQYVTCKFTKLPFTS